MKRRSQDVREKGATSATGATRNSEAAGQSRFSSRVSREERDTLREIRATSGQPPLTLFTPRC
ncbi:MAG: hypothetical protein NW202_14745 [Nitrospira sp.]|nr:hypothetical protein [Nitrospira sp.]